VTRAKAMGRTMFMSLQGAADGEIEQQREHARRQASAHVRTARTDGLGVNTHAPEVEREGTKREW